MHLLAIITLLIDAFNCDTTFECIKIMFIVCMMIAVFVVVDIAEVIIDPEFTFHDQKLDENESLLGRFALWCIAEIVIFFSYVAASMLFLLVRCFTVEAIALDSEH